MDPVKLGMRVASAWLAGDEAEGAAEALAEMVKLAIIEAVAGEREACAGIVEDTEIERYGNAYSYERPDDAQATLSKAAKAIRARGAK